MKTFNLDTDNSPDAVYADNGRGFIFMSKNNGSCYWDDSAGGVSHSSNTGNNRINTENWFTDQFYIKNFETNAMNIFVR